jgi:hypothetical protein
MPDYPLSPEVAAEIEAKVTRPQPCDRHGEWWQGSTHKPAWTPRAFLIRGDRFLLNCRACGHQAEAPAQALVDDGKGDCKYKPVVRY